MMAMLRDVVSAEGGTGALAAVPGYTVAGKTGTAAKPERGGYSDTRYVASFVGVVPAKDPRLVVLVSIDEPHGAIWGGVVAAPAFAEIARHGLVELEIPPDAATHGSTLGSEAALSLARSSRLRGSAAAGSVAGHGARAPGRRARTGGGPRAAPTPSRCGTSPTTRAPSPRARCSSASPASTRDGHDFAGEAVERGAVALVVERAGRAGGAAARRPVDARAAMAIAADAFFGEPTRELEVAGVTGTNGKTTTAFLLHAILEAAGRRPGLLGTVESRIGGEARPVVRTTPEAIDLQRTFREMLDAGDRSVALEASSHAAVLHRLDRVRFDALVFTNLTPGPPRLPRHDGGVLRGEAAALHGRRAAARRGEHRRRVGHGGSPTSSRSRAGRRSSRSASPTTPRSGRRSSSSTAPARASAPAGSRSRPTLRGRFNVENVLGAVAAGILLDVDEDEIAAGVRALAGVPGRFEAVDEGQPFTVLVDYAHTPDSLDNVLRAARELRDAAACSSSSAPAATAIAASGR